MDGWVDAWMHGREDGRVDGREDDKFGAYIHILRWPDSANLKSKLKNDGSKSQTVNKLGKTIQKPTGKSKFRNDGSKSQTVNLNYKRQIQIRKRWIQMSNGESKIRKRWI